MNNKVAQFEDFLPPKDNVIAEFMTECNAYSEGDDAYFKKRFAELINEMVEKHLYSEFVYSSYSKKEYSPGLKKLLRGFISDYELVITTWEPSKFIRTYHNHVHGHVGNSSYGMSCAFFENAPAYNKWIKDAAYLFSEEVFYFNLVNDYELANDYTFNSPYKDSEKEWAYSNPIINNYKVVKRDVDTKEYSYDFYESLGNETSFNIGIEGEIQQIERELVAKNKLNINRMINLVYFDLSTVKLINDISARYSRRFYQELEDNSDYYSRNKELITGELNQKLTNSLREKYTLFIRPIIVKHSLFELDIDVMPVLQIPKSSTYAFNDGTSVIEKPYIEELILRKCFFDFIDEVYPIVSSVERRSDKVLRYEMVLKKYFMDKDVSITPAGLIIRDIRDGENVCFNIYEQDLIDLSKVSSGERKLIIIFAVGIFFNKFLMLDEPELSLSLVWQETLLPDLLNECDNHMILATHSPYIVNDESVREYIQYLP